MNACLVQRRVWIEALSDTPTPARWVSGKPASGIWLLLACLAVVMGSTRLHAETASSATDYLESRSEAPKTWGDWPRWGDQGDGTYRNPVLPGDFSDIDCIRVGSDYYAISSTFQYSPGMVILHSKDLVNWRILGHVISDVTQIGPELHWNRMNRYGRGVWAGAIRYHAGNFWVYFGTPEEGYFMSTAKNPAGPWEPLHQMTKDAGWDDCCPFWDDDGQGYFVGTHFRDGYKTWLFKLTPDGRDLIPDSRVLLNEGSGREANKLYKINGTYYHFYSEHKPGVGRYVMMQRATNIAGPYLEKRQLSHVQREAHEPNQGGIVQTELGNWYFFTHHGTGNWEGRPASLLPVTWADGWPVLGAVGSDGLGTMVWSGRKPVLNTPIVTPQTDDEFGGPKLGMQWEWNYQPRAEKWSLSERPGFLRLHAWQPLRPNNLKTAGNTLTQRTLRTKRNVVTVELDLAGMADGQVAGLCHYNRNYATIAVRRENGELVIEAARNQTILRGPQIEASLLWLRSEWGLDGIGRFSHSTDGKNFVTLGDPYQFAWGDYRGERVGLFSYNNQGEAGYADFGSFTYHFDSPLTR
jgi:beta-xylosidase